jgi:CheY-like chemotaxis protein
MSAGESQNKIFVVDNNLFFVKRLSDALRQQGFEAIQCSEPAYALTMIEWNMPAAILCAGNFNNSAGYEIPSILRADPKTSHIPVIAIGDRGQTSQLEAIRAGYADVVDRRLGAEEIAFHLMSFLSSNRDGFQPTQMLARSETALDGRLSLVDLPGVIQVLSQSRQTGALHINADAADGIIFFDAGEIIHAESGQFAGDEAIVHLVKSCYLTKDGVYKFIPGGPATLRTVQGPLNGLILDALRELDEEERDASLETPAESDSISASQLQKTAEEAKNDSPIVSGEQAPNSPVRGATERFTATQSAIEVLPEVEVEAEDVTETSLTTDSPAEIMTEDAAGREAESGIEADSSPEAPGHEGDLNTGNTDPHPTDQFTCETIIDEDTLRELNELLSGLKVEEQESHE